MIPGSADRGHRGHGRPKCHSWGMSRLSHGERVARLLARRPVIDGHNDLAWHARLEAGYDWNVLDIGAERTDTHTDLPRLRAGGVGAQFWSVYVPGTLANEAAVIATLEQVDAVHRLITTYPNDLRLVTSPGQLAVDDGRIASMLGAEGGHSIGNSLGALRMLHRLGVRYLTLTHNHNIDWADAATDAPVLGGLSRFGEEVVREMNRIGMLADLSHVSADTMRHTLEVSTAPVVFSHSSAQAVCDSPRNVPDDVLRRLRTNGGVCMVTFVPEFVSPAAAAWRTHVMAGAEADGVDPLDLQALKAWTAAHAPAKPQATVDDVVEHVEHVRDVAGIDHVGLGGDYDGTDSLPVGLEDVSGYPRLLEALASRGWTDAELAKLAGDNIERAWSAAEAHAERLRDQAPSLARIEDLDG